jgi:hypothetical protein
VSRHAAPFSLRVALPVDAEVADWICFSVLQTMDAPGYFPASFTPFDAAQQSFVQAELARAQSLAPQGLARDRLLEHPGALLPYFLRDFLLRCAAAADGEGGGREGCVPLVSRLLKQLLRCICTSFRADDTRASSSSPLREAFTPLKSLTVAKWALSLFFNSEVFHILFGSHRCLDQSDLMHVKSYLQVRRLFALLSSEPSTLCPRHCTAVN